MLRGLNPRFLSLRWAVLAAAVILTGAWQAPPPVAASKLPTAEEINSILKELSGMTGFRIHKQFRLRRSRETGERLPQRADPAVGEAR